MIKRFDVSIQLAIDAKGRVRENLNARGAASGHSL
jgi:hypothetical protein